MRGNDRTYGKGYEGERPGVPARFSAREPVDGLRGCASSIDRLTHYVCRGGSLRFFTGDASGNGS